MGVGVARQGALLLTGGLGGGAGTLIEVAAAYQKGTPIVAVKRTGGVADRIIDTYLDDRKNTVIVGEETAEKAVIRAMSILG